jgi:hypothetical protein
MSGAKNSIENPDSFPISKPDHSIDRWAMQTKRAFQIDANLLLLKANFARGKGFSDVPRQSS